MMDELALREGIEAINGRLAPTAALRKRHRVSFDLPRTCAAFASTKVSAVLQVIASDYGVTVGDIKSRTKAPAQQWARCCAAYALVDLGYSWQIIARLLNKEHKTVRVHFQRFQKEAETSDWRCLNKALAAAHQIGDTLAPGKRDSFLLVARVVAHIASTMPTIEPEIDHQRAAERALIGTLGVYGFKPQEMAALRGAPYHLIRQRQRRHATPGPVELAIREASIAKIEALRIELATRRAAA